tara:strand:- start:1966 stop:2310 length:345 start_codon:yes stop_codon:yes gene_type:complete
VDKIMSKFFLVKNDNGSRIKATITRSDTGVAVDLSNATPKLKFKKKNTGTLLSTLASSTTSSANKEAGICEFVFTGTDLNINSGDYVGEIEITFSDGTIETIFEELDFTVREDF